MWEYTISSMPAQLIFLQLIHHIHYARVHHLAKILNRKISWKHGKYKLSGPFDRGRYIYYHCSCRVSSIYEHNGTISALNNSVMNTSFCKLWIIFLSYVCTMYSHFAHTVEVKSVACFRFDLFQCSMTEIYPIEPHYDGFMLGGCITSHSCQGRVASHLLYRWVAQ